MSHAVAVARYTVADLLRSRWMLAPIICTAITGQHVSLDRST
jgi:hypothetical protein